MNYENYEEDWAIYFTRLDKDEFCSILVDLGLNIIAPDESKPFLITTTIYMNNPADDGFSSDSENDTLNQIEDNFIELFNSKYKATYAGRLKFGGKIQSIFYSENVSEIENIISEIKKIYPAYRFEHNTKEERDWKAYFELLYPSPMEMQSIQNARVVENLEKHGDKLEKERLVEHWIYFPSEAERESFLSSIENDEFEIVSKNLNKDFDEKPYELIISRVDKTDYDSVDEYILYLWEKAQEFNSDYDGWETFVVKD